MKKGITLFMVKVTVKVQNVSECWSDDIFWVTEHFVTRFGVMMQQHEPECHADLFFSCCYLQGEGHTGGNVTLLYFLNCCFFGNQTWSDNTSPEAGVSCEKEKDTAFRVKVTAKGQNVNVCPDDIFCTTQYFVSRLGIVMHHYESECHAKRLIYYFQGQGHCKSLYDQNLAISTISFNWWSFWYQVWFHSTLW